MGRARKAVPRNPLAPKDPNIPQPPLPQQQDRLQDLIDANHREVERRIAAIRAVRDAEVEGFLTQLRVARSMLSEEVQAMRFTDFVERFCPDREAVQTDNGIIELRQRNVGIDCPGAASSFEFPGEVPGSAVSSIIQPTPMGFPFSSSSAKEQLLRSIGKHTQNEASFVCSAGNIHKNFKPKTRSSFGLFSVAQIGDEGLFKFLDFCRDSKAPLHPGVNTPSNTHLMVGMTPKTERVPKRGEPLLSVNGSPLGIYGDQEIMAIPEEYPRKVRRKLRASATNSQI